MADCSSSVAHRKMARRKLNAIGEINAYSVLANDEPRMKKLKQAHQLADTLGSMNDLKKTEKQKSDHEKEAALRDIAPAAIDKLIASGGDVEGAKLSIPQLRSVLLVHMHKVTKATLAKTECVDLFRHTAAAQEWSPSA